MEQAVDFNLILGIIFGLLGIILLMLWIAVPFVLFSIKKRLDETNRRLEEIISRRPEHILAKGLEEILLEIKTLTKAVLTQSMKVEEKSKNKRQKHRVTQLYLTPSEEDPNK